MNLRWRLKKLLSKEQTAEIGYLRRALGVTLRDKKHRYEIRKAQDVKPFSESRDPNYIRSAMCPKCPRKEWRTKSFGLQSIPPGKRPKVCPRARWRDYISDLAWYRLDVEPGELSEIADDRGVCRVLLGLLPPWLSPKKKQAPKWASEWVCRSTLNLSVNEIVFSLVCLPKVNVVLK